MTENNIAGSCKRRRHLTVNEKINELSLKWVKDATRGRINVTGPFLKEKALNFAPDMDNTTSKASNV